MQLGIIGSDNSHAEGFAKLVNLEQAFGSDVHVVALWGADADQAAAVAKSAAVHEVVASPETLAEMVDAAVVVDRDGGRHRAHAASLIEAGRPVLVDKPLATTVDDAKAILELAQSRRVAVTSYSSLRWCEATKSLQAARQSLGEVRTLTVSGPCDLSSPYGGHFFYGIHLAEIALAICPGMVSAVRAVRGEAVTTVLVERDDRLAVTLHLIDPDGPAAGPGFQAAMVGTEGSAAREIQQDPDLHAAMSRFLDMVLHGSVPVSEEDMLEPIRLLETVTAALEADGRAVSVYRETAG